MACKLIKSLSQLSLQAKKPEPKELQWEWSGNKEEKIWKSDRQVNRQMAWEN